MITPVQPVPTPKPSNGDLSKRNNRTHDPSRHANRDRANAPPQASARAKAPPYLAPTAAPAHPTRAPTTTPPTLLTLLPTSSPHRLTNPYHGHVKAAFLPTSFPPNRGEWPRRAPARVVELAPIFYGHASCERHRHCTASNAGSGGRR